MNDDDEIDDDDDDDKKKKKKKKKNIFSTHTKMLYFFFVNSLSHHSSSLPFKYIYSVYSGVIAAFVLRQPAGNGSFLINLNRSHQSDPTQINTSLTYS
jgi:hypothetical protein